MGKEFAFDTELNAISETTFGSSEAKQANNPLDETLTEFTALYQQLKQKYGDNENLILIKLIEVAQNKNSKLYTLIEKL